ncbi:MAG: amidohydrolase [Clostridiaceae bacterium]
MKQEVISYLSTIKEEIFNISKFIYENPEESYKEHNSSKLLVKILEKHNFDIKNNFLNMGTAFHAQFGSGHPKICFLCDYDAHTDQGDILGNNLVSAMSVGAAISLAKVIPKIGGSVIIIGCPGELKGGSKTIMVKEHVFEDIDAVLMARPHVTSAESGTSMATLPIEINYTSSNQYYNTHGSYSALTAGLFTLQGLQLLIDGYGENCSINGIAVKTPSTPHFSPTVMDTTVYLKASKMKTLCEVEKKIRNYVKTTETLMNVKGELHFHQLPCDELISNKTISRIFSHNLKESGIIDINPPRNTHLGMSLGSVSFVVPTICPYISITDNNNLEPYSKEFSDATISEKANDSLMKGIQSLASTAIDLIEKQELLAEAKKELYNYTKISCIEEEITKDIN